MRVAAPIVLTGEQRSELSTFARGRSAALRLVERANIILQAAAGKQDQEIAAALQVGRHTVARWRARFLRYGIRGIEKDAPRPGRARTIDQEEIIRKTTQEKPANGTHWTTRTLARALGISEATVRRTWHAHGLKPHLVDTFKVSRDPQFVEKLEDIVGLYLNPPQQAIVFSVDEKSQIQALDRTQPGLPMKKGRNGTITHDYKRHGTTTLFAALNTLTGEVLSQCRPRHTNEDWLAFLRLIARNTSKDKQIHVIADNYSPHKHPAVKAWLARNKRVHMHFTPTSASWLNMVERFFRDITEKRIRRGVFRSVPELVTAIEDYIQNHNRAPKPFIWTAKASDILEKVTRARRTLDKVASE
jgi:transposase